MGVFTVGRQVALEIDMPGWWLANASVDMDFRRGLYYDSSTANPRAATDFLSCVRASTGYATTAAGTLTSFASNALRITDLGLLVEDARTNYAPDSEVINTTTWSAVTSGTVSTNNTTSAPNGTTTADSQAFSGTSYIYATSSTVPNATQNWTFSIWLSGTGITAIRMFDAAAHNTYQQAVTLTGTLTRYVLTGSLQVDAGQIIFGIDNRALAGGDEAAKTVIAWGAQLEIGAFASSYIPTTGAAATRAADAVTCISTLDAAIDGAVGSVVADVILYNVTVAGPNYRILADAAGGSNSMLYWRTATILPDRVGSYNGAAELSAALSSGTFQSGTKVGLAWNSSPSRSLVGNGGTVASDAGIVGNGTNVSLMVYSADPTQSGYGYVRRLTAWSSKLADATLQGFTV